MQQLRVLATCAFAIVLCASCTPSAQQANAEIRITLGDAAAEGIAALGLDVPVVGRAFFIVARNNEEMPHLGTGVTGNPLWGVDVRDYKAGDTAVIVDGKTVSVDTRLTPWTNCRRATTTCRRSSTCTRPLSEPMAT